MSAQENVSRILSVRVPGNVYRAYEQIDESYGVKQSELVRMAPLLFLLLAERSLARRWQEISEREKTLPSPQDPSWDWNEFRDIDRERTAVSNNEVLGQKFVQHLRELTEEIHNTDAVSAGDIDETADGLLQYTIFQKELLRKAAHEIADKVPEHQIDSLLQPGADNHYDGQLLSVASKNLGIDELENRQKGEVRQNFRDALKMRQEFIQNHADDQLRQAAYEVARSMVRPEDAGNLLKQIDSGDGLEVPRRYDGRLLAISRTKLGKTLNTDEKSAVRKLFRDALKSIPANDSQSGSGNV